MAMPRKAGPPKRQVLIRLLETTAQKLEELAKAKGFESLPAYLADSIERQVAGNAKKVQSRFKGEKS